ncbi:type II toxin-antitoxin system Phd/YefM family antitoxin [Streptomyces sp. NPDC006458]|uniref:type II toxin-antitoxin system Phd/YefM family antitoxin n=1 Tax=Streptomyces sp. NPDC006458 TaxID=3154302 RepID=UPI0033B0F9E2
MQSVELAEAVEEFGRPVALVEATGERVTLVEEGEAAAVLLPAAEPAGREHFAQRHRRASTPLPEAAEERLPGPERHGPYTRYVHADGQCATFTRERVIVAELRPAAWLDQLEQWALHGRQRYMDPRRAAAFEEFLARQERVGEG